VPGAGRRSCRAWAVTLGVTAHQPHCTPAPSLAGVHILPAAALSVLSLVLVSLSRGLLSRNGSLSADSGSIG